MARPADDSLHKAVLRAVGRLTLRKKLFVVFATATVAVMMPGLVVPLLSTSEDAALWDVARELVPEADASRALLRTLERVNEGVQLAAASADPGAMRTFDATRHETTELLDVLARSTDPIAGTLAASINGYVALAQRAIEHALAGSAGSTELATALEAFERLRPRVVREIDRRSVAVDRGFSAVSAHRDGARNVGLFGAFVLVVTFIVTLRLVLVPLEKQLAHVRAAFDRFAKGDFNTEVPVLTRDELGALAREVNATAKRLDTLVHGLRSTAAQLNTAAAEMSATSNQHQRGASEQSSAVEETQRTMQSMLASMDQINASIDSVLENAEQTQDKNQLIAESIVTLSTQADGITEVLATIKDIANKAELLALNAALEGTKAGEVGRGFSLVATQMQRLAENVQRAVADIKHLTETIRRASTDSVLATEEGTKLAADTTRSAREIRLVMQQHQTATRQVTAAMDDVASVAQQTAASSREILTSSQDLAQLSEHLLDTTSQLGAEVTARRAEAS